MSFDSQRTSDSAAERDMTMEIIRDPGFGGDWYNRYCQNAETHEVLYYCDVFDDSNLEFHRGNKNGPVVARSRRCSSNPGATDILLTEARSAHLHHEEHTARTSFTNNGRKYQWNAKRELVDDAGKVLAQLSLVNDTQKRSGGKLTIKPEAYASSSLKDPIVMTAMIVQERFDESKSWF